MGRKEKIEEYKLKSLPPDPKVVEQKLQQRLSLVETVLSNLNVEEQLLEIKRDIWGVGEVTETKDLQGLSKTIILKATWPGFEPSHSEYFDNDATDNRSATFHPATRACVILCQAYIEVVGKLSSTEKEHIEISLDGFCGSRFSTDSYSQRLDQKIEMGLLNEFTTQQAVASLDSQLTYVCTRINNGEPLQSLIEKDRQEIINKVKSGELERSDIPADFGYIPL